MNIGIVYISLKKNLVVLWFEINICIKDFLDININGVDVYFKFIYRVVYLCVIKFIFCMIRGKVD